MSDQADVREGQRIAKVMARVGLCSRRDAEQWIAEGRVSVNGEVLTSPAFNVSEADEVRVDGEPLRSPERTRLFQFHKPRGLVTTAKDPEGRRTIFDALPEDLPRVVAIGRLDINTEGLLLLTNDGGVARVLELPATGWLRRYRVRAHGEITQEQLDGLRDGVTIDGVNYLGIEARFERQQGSNVWLTMGLREGKNREIKRVLEHMGLSVNRLIRVSFGPFELGDLGEGEVVEVRTRVLRDQLGAKLARAAGANFDTPEDIPAAPPEPAHEIAPLRTLAAPERRDTPQRKRKHVSVLRAEARQEAAGPRKRVARATTTDRRGREVKIERVSLARPAPPTRPRGEGRFGRPAGAEGLRPERPPRREAGAEPPRRSGFGRPERADGARAERPPRRDAGAEPPRRGGFSRPDRADGARTERPPRREAGAEPPRRGGFSRPDRADGARTERPPRREAGAEPPRRGGFSRPDRADGARTERPPRREAGAEPPRRGGFSRPDRADGARTERPPRREAGAEPPRRGGFSRPDRADGARTERPPRREAGAEPPRRGGFSRPDRADGARTERPPRREAGAEPPRRGGFSRPDRADGARTERPPRREAGAEPPRRGGFSRPDRADGARTERPPRREAGAEPPRRGGFSRPDRADGARTERPPRREAGAEAPRRGGFGRPDRADGARTERPPRREAGAEAPRRGGFSRPDRADGARAERPPRRDGGAKGTGRPGAGAKRPRPPDGGRPPPRGGGKPRAPRGR